LDAIAIDVVFQQLQIDLHFLVLLKSSLTAPIRYAGA
jgi:hypothetical protein